MKSFEKFQYDASPYEIDEEVEELDEFVGQLRKAGEKIGNVLQKTSTNLKAAGKNMAQNVRNIPKNVSKTVTSAASSVKDTAKKVSPTAPRDIPTPTKQAPKDPNSPIKTLPQDMRRFKKTAASGAPMKGQFFTKKEVRDRAQSLNRFRNIKNRNDAIRNPIKTLTSPTARTIGSGIKNVAQGVKDGYANQKRVSSTDPGTGFGSPLMGGGAAFQGAVKGALNTKTFDKNTVIGKDSKTGKEVRKLGDQRKETVGDRLKSMALRTRGVVRSKSKEEESKEKVPASKNVSSGGKVTTGSATDARGRDTAARIRDDREKQGKKDVLRKAQLISKSAPNVPGIDRPIIKKGDEVVQSAKRRNQKRIAKNLKFQAKQQRQADARINDALGSEPPADILKDLQDFSNQRSSTNTSNSNNSVKQGPKMKRPNIRSYEGDVEGYRKAQAQYNAQDPEFKTRKGAGRPKKPPTNEEFVSWREEFIWETEKIPSKKKDGRGMHPHGEIKPMSGKNNVAINPEDQSAKYKRGY